MAQLTSGSMFSGYGGLDLAIEAAFGARTAWVAEVDKAASRVLARRFPHAPNLGDVTTIDWSSMEPVDIIGGGSPCQDISTAGKRAGMTAGTRSNLWAVMREAIAVIRPRFVVWENVYGALSARASSAMESDPRLLDEYRPEGGGSPVLRAAGRVLGDLAELGYDAEWVTVRASDVGACHQRARVFVLAWDANRVDPEGYWPEGQQVAVPDAGAGIPLGTDRGSHGLSLLPTPRATRGGSSSETVALLLPTPTSSLGDNGGPQHPDKRRAGGHSVSIDDAIHGLNLLPTPKASDADYGMPNTSGRPLDKAQHLVTRAKLLVIEGPQVEWGKYAAAIARHGRVFGRPAPAPITTGARGGRKLSGEFTEWMMGLPHGWIWELVEAGEITNNASLRMAGNGVIPQQALHALRIILSRLHAEEMERAA